MSPKCSDQRSLTATAVLLLLALLLACVDESVVRADDCMNSIRARNRNNEALPCESLNELFTTKACWKREWPKPQGFEHHFFTYVDEYGASIDDAFDEIEKPVLERAPCRCACGQKHENVMCPDMVAKNPCRGFSTIFGKTIHCWNSASPTPVSYQKIYTAFVDGTGAVLDHKLGGRVLEAAASCRCACERYERPPPLEHDTKQHTTETSKDDDGENDEKQSSRASSPSTSPATTHQRGHQSSSYSPSSFSSSSYSSSSSSYAQPRHTKKKGWKKFFKW